MQLFAAAEAPELYAGMTLITPFVGLVEEQQLHLDSLKPYAQVLNWVYPTYAFSDKKDFPSWMQHWRDDPNDLSNKINVNSVLQVD